METGITVRPRLLRKRYRRTDGRFNKFMPAKGSTCIRFITASEKIFDRLCVDFETALESAQRQLVEYREIYE